MKSQINTFFFVLGESNLRFFLSKLSNKGIYLMGIESITSKHEIKCQLYKNLERERERETRGRAIGEGQEAT